MATSPEREEAGNRRDAAHKKYKNLLAQYRENDLHITAAINESLAEVCAANKHFDEVFYPGEYEARKNDQIGE